MTYIYLNVDLRNSVEPGWAWSQRSLFCWRLITRPAHPISRWLIVRYVCIGSNVPCPPDFLRTSRYIYCK